MKFFKNDKNEVNSPKSERKSSGLFFGKILVYVVAIAILAGFILQVNNVFQRIATNWNAIKFAYDKPAIVSVVRDRYYSKEQQMDQSFLISTPSAQEQLVQQVVNKLKQSK